MRLNLSAAEHVEERQLAELLDRYLVSLEQGAPLDIGRLAEEHPHLADDLHCFAKSIDMLHHATEGLNNQEDPTEAHEGEVTELSDKGCEKRLGDFEIHRELGRGGMGIVYEARQISLQRPVALKVLPFAAMWDGKQLARFRNEAQAAAQLHHPNIVPVYAVGQERGIHYYAMQRIHGDSLEHMIRALAEQRHLAARGETRPNRHDTTLSIGSAATPKSSCEVFASQFVPQASDYCRKVAELGMQAAGALEHAHECGVVHRDIKPSNLLLDESGKVWVTDFGLARIENSPGVTMTGDVVGTLRYMSPEQAAGQQALIDPRSDIYSLGASLYELLTLRPAFPGEDRQQVLRAIVETEPIAPRHLNPSIPHDLETIVLQAMSKSREDRYESAQQFADDLSRFLQGRPTIARRPSLLDRTGKWVRRHRALVSAAAASLVLITAISVVAVLLLSQEQARTRAALLTAEENLQQAREVVDRFGSHFDRQLALLPGSEPLRREVLQDTLQYYQNFIERSVDDPSLQHDLATTHFQAAMIAFRLGEHASAEESFKAAERLFQQISSEQVGSERFLEERATCLNNLGMLQAEQGNFELAQSHYRRAIGLQRRAMASQTDRRDSYRPLAEILTNFGFLERQRGDMVAARALLTEAIGLLRQEAEHSPESERAIRDLAMALNNRSFIEQRLNWQQARASCEEAIRLLTGLVEQTDPQSSELASRRSDVALCYNNLGAILGHLNDSDGAIDAYREAIALQEQLVRQSYGVVQHRSELGISWNNLGQALFRNGARTEAIEAYHEAEKQFSQLVADFPEESRYRSSLAGVLNNRAMAAEQAGDVAAALVDYEAAIQEQQIAWKQSGERAQYREYLSKHYFNYGRALLKAGNAIQAAEVALKRRELWSSDGKRLVEVARELAASAEQLESDPEQQQRVRQQAIATLKRAISGGESLRSLTEGRPLPAMLQTWAEQAELTDQGRSI